ncbi:MAG: response regulator, partial [Deltaproteobacteria bacterium]|nr:response regulator [Deltaproteobacteria bacterium]
MPSSVTDKKKALIADDDESVVWVLDEFLREKGFETIKASDGTEASALIRTPGLTIALLDINMPGKDGLEIL